MDERNIMKQQTNWEELEAAKRRIAELEQQLKEKENN